MQVVLAAAIAATASATGMASIAAIGLICHAAWDVWHLYANREYVPAWYAGACVYVDLAAAILVVVL